ncbi:helix-turn-helix domain-containing protein [Ruegeria sediminis]|uniref:Helix-turn-helix domain-containing protein n=1 Tax=Ruegeria sediminis TaxID=2583820 RepID=A0ABY2X4K3_9RHOB|nr:helix-turn-helix domain-containing protein [Ruegeria sediminis]TMV10326.1 helix-turn-helix domain-containing protein [Ruegeria sediminis]
MKNPSRTPHSQVSYNAIDQDLEITTHLRRPYNLKASRWASTVPGIGANARSILWVLAQFCDEFGVVWHSHRSIAFHAQCSERTARTHLASLKEKGLIRIVGRLSKEKGKTSNAYVLTGWPERTLMPVSGHPKLGRSVNEDKYDRLVRSWQKKNSPKGSAEVTERTNNIEKDPYYTAEKDPLVEIEKTMNLCRQALGPWCTDENREHLGRDLSGFLDLTAMGFSLEAVILPVLREKSTSRQKVPTLKSWAYFLEPMQRRADVLAKNQAAKKKSQDEMTSTPSQDCVTTKGNPSEAQKELKRNIDGILKHASKSCLIKPNWEDE